jgi:hypothetical protein
MGDGTFSTLQLPNDIVETAAVVAAETLIKLLLESGYLLLFSIELGFIFVLKLLIL